MQVSLANCSVLVREHLYKLIRLTQSRFNRPIVVAESKTRRVSSTRTAFQSRAAWCGSSLRLRWLRIRRGFHRDLSQAAPSSIDRFAAGEAVRVETCYSGVMSAVCWFRGESSLHPLSVADGRVVQHCKVAYASSSWIRCRGRLGPNERPVTYNGILVHPKPNTRMHAAWQQPCVVC